MGLIQPSYFIIIEKRGKRKGICKKKYRPQGLSGNPILPLRAVDNRVVDNCGFRPFFMGLSTGAKGAGQASGGSKRV